MEHCHPEYSLRQEESRKKKGFGGVERERVREEGKGQKRMSEGEGGKESGKERRLMTLYELWDSDIPETN